MAMNNDISARLVLQRCESARLQVQPPLNTEPAQFVTIRRGMIAFVGFYENAVAEVVDKIAKVVCTVRMLENEKVGGKLASLGELPGDLLIIPQFCLAGRVKGRLFQYHTAIGKDSGAQLYHSLVDRCKEMLMKDAAWREAGCSVQCGTYGNRQVLSTETNGPYTHVVDI